MKLLYLAFFGWDSATKAIPSLITNVANVTWVVYINGDIKYRVSDVTQKYINRHKNKCHNKYGYFRVISTTLGAQSGYLDYRNISRTTCYNHPGFIDYHNFLNNKLCIHIILLTFNQLSISHYI